MKIEFFETERLLLRSWKEKDVEDFVRINQDEKVIEFLRGPMSYLECRDFIFGANRHIEKHGFGLWAVELKAKGELIGFVGLNCVDFTPQFNWEGKNLAYPTSENPWERKLCVEIAWRLGSQFWGEGYATEAALECLHVGFEEFGLQEIVSFTAWQNLRSRAVMERLGMLRDLRGDFCHPKLLVDHRLSRHVLYRKKVV